MSNDLSKSKEINIIQKLIQITKAKIQSTPLFVKLIAPPLILVLIKVAGDIFSTILQKPNDYLAWYHALVVLVLIALVIGLMQLFDRIEKLNNKSRFSLSYFTSDRNDDEDNAKKNADSLYSECIRIIRRTQKDAEIFAVNSFVEMFQDSEDNSIEQRRIDYFTEIEAQLSKVKLYHRLLQLHDVELKDIPIIYRIANTYRNHFMNVLSKLKTKKSGILIEKVRAKYPISFVLIINPDGSKYLIWQVNEHVHEQDEMTIALKLHGVFIVSDPDEQVIKYFIKWFRELQSDTERVPLRIDDLTSGSPQEIVKYYYKKVDTKEWDSILVLFADDIEYQRGKVRIIGKSELTDFYHKMRQICDGVHAIDSISSENNNIIAKGTFSGHLKDGQALTTTFTDKFTFVNGKISNRETVFDGKEI